MLVFFGTSPRSARFLDLAIQNGLKVDLVVSSPPKPIGKEQILTENPVVTLAKKLGIPHTVILSEMKDLLNVLKKDSSPAKPDQNDTAQDNQSLGFILDFQQIVPNSVINLFEKGIINVHFSKLPLLRGPAPVQYTILSGNKNGWITYYLIDEKLDAGPIIAQTSLPLDLTENTETLYQKLIEKSAQEAPHIVNDYLSDRIRSSQQRGVPTFTKKLTSENCKIDWKKSPEEIDRLIRAANPEPGAWTEVELRIKNPSFAKATAGRQESRIKRLKITNAHLEQGKLVLDTVLLEGKNPVSIKQFEQGYPQFELL